MTAPAIDPDWWKTLFDEVYLLTDARSVDDEELTRREVDLIRQLLPLQYPHRILDLCGGHGRHSLELSSRGFGGCTVLDYSPYLLRRGQTEAAARRRPVKFIRADARNTGLIKASFDCVLILGNSLGYLPEVSADKEILGEAHRLLRSGGRLLAEVSNGRKLKARFQPSAWHEIGEEIVVCRQRKLDKDRVRTREIVLHKKSGLIRERSYTIRLFEPETLRTLLVEAGFVQVKVHTDSSPYKKSGYYGLLKHRLLVTAQKP